MNMLKLITFSECMVPKQDKETAWGEKQGAQVRIHFQGQQAAVITGGQDKAHS